MPGFHPTSAPRTRFWNSRAAPMSVSRAFPPMRGEMFEWTAPLFEGESLELATHPRGSASLYSDIGWRRHPDDRARARSSRCLTAPFAGADHRARALIAASVFPPLYGDENSHPTLALAELLDKDDERRALQLGLAWRFAFSSVGLGGGGSLAITGFDHAREESCWRCRAEARSHRPEPVQKRLGALAESWTGGAKSRRLTGLGRNQAWWKRALRRRTQPGFNRGRRPDKVGAGMLIA